MYEVKDDVLYHTQETVQKFNKQDLLEEKEQILREFDLLKERYDKIKALLAYFK